MKRKKKIYRLTAVLMALLILAGNVFSVWAEENVQRKTAKHYNVVLVIDGSGSLTYELGTDKEGYRYEALELFLSVLTNEGNKVGAIVFNDSEKMPLDTGLKELNTMAAKKELSQSIRDTKVDGDTDIGGALQQAISEVTGSEADPELPSCILLFSDGETDLGSPDATNVSLKKKEQAIADARKDGIAIHGICLNANNSANTQEVKGIAEGTNGIYLEINTPSDLNNAFLEFYSLIYGESRDPGEWEVGPVEKTFRIPSEGVAEVNILIEAEKNITGINLTRPDGTSYSETELDAISIATGKYKVIKIVDPIQGVWKIKVEGDPGTKIKFDWIYNTDLSAEIECNSEKASLNENIAIKGYLLSDGKRVQDTNVYSEYSGTLVLTNAVTGEASAYPMETDGTAFSTDVEFSEYGTYYAAIKLTCGNMVHTSNSTAINVGNQAPVAEKKTIQKKIVLLPFKSAKTTFDLNDYVSDPEGDELTFELGTYSYDADKVKLKDGSLSIDADKVKEGNVKVTAKDSQGASCELTFNIKTQNFTILIVVLLILILLAVLTVLLMSKNKQYTTVCPWTITVESFDNVSGISSQPYPQTGLKGRKNISAWNITECGIQGDFVAEYIKGKKGGGLKFVSKQPFETEGGQIIKEYKFILGDDVKLFAPSATDDDHMVRGVRIIVTDSMDW